MTDVGRIFSELGGVFCVPAEQFAAKVSAIRAFIFDWDGVFNDGTKNQSGSSSFGEVDAMGSNLLRYSWWSRHGVMPIVALMSGARNAMSFQFGMREHTHNIYFNVKNKLLAFEHFVASHKLAPESVAFFFDDVLDLALAEKCGLRIMVNRKSSPLFTQFVIERGLADYVTAHSGANSGLREACELLMGTNGNYNDVVQSRAWFSETYATYLKERDQIPVSFFTWDGLNIVPAPAP
ncbi:MAG: phosphatase [Bacteroidota bacterium]|jgi:3-deoxy-D-manno-octulosonate 8-phosphate phosphatase (KDO 8-P phosphatase)|nr:MAG: phosphatase [Bacteroidota bacterium]